MKLQGHMMVWRLFLRWSRLDLDPRSLTAGERWSVVATTVPSVLRSRYLRPASLWLLARTPAWIVARRLQRRTHDWYRVPNQEAADHVRLRFDIWPIDIGDHVRLQHGRLTAVGYATPTFTEIIFVLPTGELEPYPNSLKGAERGRPTRGPAGDLSDQIWGHLEAPGALRRPKGYVEHSPVGRKPL